MRRNGDEAQYTASEHPVHLSLESVYKPPKQPGFDKTFISTSGDNTRHVDYKDDGVKREFRQYLLVPRLAPHANKQHGYLRVVVYHYHQTRLYTTNVKARQVLPVNWL